jgi:LEA14-like dessication related protein
MSMRQRAIRFISLLAAGVLLQGCAALKEQIKEPQVSIQSVQLREASLSEAQLDFLLNIDNPNPLGIAMQGLSYNLKLDSKQLFDGRSGERVQVPANGSATVALPFVVDYEELLGGLGALRNTRSVAYELSGEVDLGLLSLPYRKQGKITLPRLPQVQVERLEVSGFSLSGVALVLGLSVSNGNDFPLRLSAFDGAVRLAGVPLVEGRSLGALDIGAGQRDSVELALNVAYSKLGEVIDVLRQGDSLPVDFNGTMRVPGLSGEHAVPVSWRGDVPISR